MVLRVKQLISRAGFNAFMTTMGFLLTKDTTECKEPLSFNILSLPLEFAIS